VCLALAERCLYLSGQRVQVSDQNSLAFWTQPETKTVLFPSRNVLAYGFKVPEVINDDSRTADLLNYIAKKNPGFYDILEKKGIDGIFTSPPYVGQIDYHEQHAYAYELFRIDRRDSLEIGRQASGTSRKAQSDYISGISAVLLNMKKYLKKDAPIFIVANDKWNLYPEIAEKIGLEITEIFRRPVLNRTERDKQPYSESIFHMVFS